MNPWEYTVAFYQEGTGAQLAWSTVPTVMAWNATVVSVHDGDTATFDIDIWHNETVRTSVRFLGCNAAELGTPSGDAAAAYVTGLLPVGTQVVLTHCAPDKFGDRTDAAITFLYNGSPTDLVALLIAEQYAAAWNGTGPRPVPPWPRTVP